MADKTDSNKKRVLECLEESRGIVTTACQNANIARSQFYEWVNTDPEFKAAVEAVNESAIDHVESKLLEKINGISMATKSKEDGDPIVYTLPPSDTAIIFFLKCRAKKRGYVERTEVVPMDPDGNPLQNVITVNVVSPKTEQ